MNLRRYCALFLIVLLVAACQKAEEKATPTPDESSINAASTLFAQPTRAAHLTPTVTPMNEVELDLSRLVADMEQSVMAGDYDTYLTHIWDGDPVFWTEHSRWAQDWHEHPLSAFNIELYGVESTSPTTATARMTVTWSQLDRTSAGGATVSAIFYEDGDQWKLGGENWHTLEDEGIRFYYFSNEILDNTPQALIVQEYLSPVYSRITQEFDFTPQSMAHIKMYESASTLQTWTRLSMPAIAVWNEPGEAIKLTLGPSNTAPAETLIAREYTRFVLFEMSGGTHGAFPWWLEEGIAEYGGSLFRTLSQRNRMLKQIASVAAAPPGSDRHLFAWDDLVMRPNLSSVEYERAVNQAFSLVQYVSDTYGADARNAWIQAIAGGESLDKATPAHLEIDFDALETAWRDWLMTQL